MESLKPLWTPTPKQAEALKRNEFEIFYGGARGGGKLLTKDTLVLTPFGWKQHGSLKVGDKVCATDGSITEVINVFPHKDQDVYRVYFNDGTEIDAGLDHNWFGWRANKFQKVNNKRKSVAQKWTTREIKEWTDKNKRFAVPLVEPTTFNVSGKLRGSKHFVKREIAPYLLGVLIGDGSILNKHVGITSMDKEVIEECNILSYSTYPQKDNKAIQYNITGDERKKIWNSLEDLGLDNHRSWEKFIPRIYLFSSIGERWSLLQGLMDTDGWAEEKRACYYTTTSERLADDIMHLARSLGALCTKTYKPLNAKNKNHHDAWCVRIKIRNPEDCFRLKRKKDIAKTIHHQSFAKYIEKIKKVGREDMDCIEVRHPNSLYIVDGFTITHNTDAGIVFPMYHIDKRKFRALVIRKNAEDLKDWIDRAKEMYRPAKGEAVGNPAEFRFPSGAIIRSGHLKDENAFEKYQGHEYQNMVIEELTQIPSLTSYLKLITSCRSTIDGIPSQIFLTSNPGGPGHKWVKKRFIDVAEPGTSYTDPVTGRKRVFISAKVQDNPYLMEKDPQYLAMLNGLPDGLREAWRDGSWESFDIKGAYYTKEIAQARKEGRITKIPYEPNLLVHTFWDLGMNNLMTIGFFQYYGREKRMIDYYENHGYGLEYYVKVLEEKGYTYGEHYFPHDIKVKELGTGKSRKEVLEGLGIKVNVVPKLSIEDGIQAVRIVFPNLWIDSEKCELFIDAISQYRQLFDEQMQRFKNDAVPDWTTHASDMLRYFAIGSDLQFKDRGAKQYRPDYTQSSYRRN